ncbi:MAG: enoyl-CoA hydratase/isomerase family protein, partial [Mesorhizobium sp.]
MADRLVSFEQDGAIGIVTLRRPEKFNALDIP